MLKSQNTISLSIEHNESNKRSSVQPESINLEVKKDGIGIENFLHGKVILITGATGFFAKVLVEKILRSMPDVSKIYLIIRGKNTEHVKRRLKEEIVDTELFKCLKQKYGKEYEAFMWSKLVAVVGNVEDSDLGIQEDLIIEIANDVQIIVNSAGNTTFDERYDVALQVNAMGPCHLMNFAKKCKNLDLFVHISTYAVKRQSREGIFMEEMESFRFRDSMKIETTILENEMRLISDYKKFLKHDDVIRKMKELGLLRAKGYGWANIYGFTKFMGEMLIDKMRGQISVPILILRPGSILSTYKEPFPGWIEGNRTVDPVIFYYAKGELTSFPVNPNCLYEMMPVDMLVNATLVAMAKHISMGEKADMNIYNFCASTSNPLVIDDLFTFIYQHFRSRPYIDPNGQAIQVSEMKLMSSRQDFSDHLSRSISKVIAWPNRVSSKKLFEMMKFKDIAEYMATCYMPYGSHIYWCDNSKTRRLIERMCEEEKKKFGCDVKSIDWKDFIVNVHIPGLRRHVWKEKGLSKM